jgi:uncharacterized membrane protein YphA (DoxX/SURF4 family)
MRIASTASRYLLGLIFIVFGVNGLFPFLPQPQLPTGNAGHFHMALADSHYFLFVYALQLLAGILLLAGRFVPLALTLLAAILTNILLFHLTMEPKGIVPGLVASLLWILTFLRFRESFRPLFRSRSEPMND